jgi:hypothetical protein
MEAGQGRRRACFRCQPRIRPRLAGWVYALPCTISGQLRAQDKAWTYRINAASTATWTSADLVRTFGCSANACKSLVLMMPDNNAGP